MTTAYLTLAHLIPSPVALIMSAAIFVTLMTNAWAGDKADRDADGTYDAGEALPIGGEAA